MNCGNICLVKQGKYMGTVTEGPEYETCAMLGSNLGIDDFAAVLQGNSLCDELDGEPIPWGNADVVLELIRKIAYREDVGAILADGSKKVIEKTTPGRGQSQRKLNRAPIGATRKRSTW